MPAKQSKKRVIRAGAEDDPAVKKAKEFFESLNKAVKSEFNKVDELEPDDWDIKVVTTLTRKSAPKKGVLKQPKKKLANPVPPGRASTPKPKKKESKKETPISSPSGGLMRDEKGRFLPKQYKIGGATKKVPAKKVAAKKTPAKKVAAKKTPVKKSVKFDIPKKRGIANLDDRS
jgi:hypothetical protein